MLYFFFDFYISLDGALSCKIGLVTGNGDNDVGTALLLKFCDPRLGLLKGLGAGYVVHNNGGLGASVIHGSK